jgi:hypothetical protein
VVDFCASDGSKVTTVTLEGCGFGCEFECVHRHATNLSYDFLFFVFVFFFMFRID